MSMETRNEMISIFAFFAWFVLLKWVNKRYGGYIRFFL